MFVNNGKWESNNIQYYINKYQIPDTEGILHKNKA